MTLNLERPLRTVPEAIAPPHTPGPPAPPCRYSRESGCRKTENGDQAQAHAGLIPAVLGAFPKHVPYPLEGAVGAAGEVAGAQFLPDHGCCGTEEGSYKEKERGPSALAVLHPMASQPHPQF